MKSSPTPTFLPNLSSFLTRFRIPNHGTDTKNRRFRRSPSSISLGHIYWPRRYYGRWEWEWSLVPETVTKNGVVRRAPSSKEWKFQNQVPTVYVITSRLVKLNWRLLIHDTRGLSNRLSHTQLIKFLSDTRVKVETVNGR